MRYPGCVSGIDNPQRYGLVGELLRQSWKLDGAAMLDSHSVRWHIANIADAVRQDIRIRSGAFVPHEAPFRFYGNYRVVGQVLDATLT